MMVLFFLYLNLFCLSPDSNLDLLDQVIISPKLFSLYKKEAMDQLPSFSHSSNDIREHISKNCLDGRFFKTLSSLTVPLLLNEQAKSDIKTHILSQFQVYENPLKRHITIIGAGPIGLLTAIELGLHGHQITLIEKRPTYSRDRLFINFDIIFHFFQKFCPQDLLVKLDTEIILIKHFEEWMFTVFKATQQLNPSIQILYGTFTDYTFKNNQLTVFFEQDNQTISLPSDCLFGCDGAHSSVRDRIQEDCGYTIENLDVDVHNTADTLILAPTSKQYLSTRLAVVWKGTHSQILYRTGKHFYTEQQELGADPLFCKHCIPLSLYAQIDTFSVSYQHSDSYLSSDSQAPVFLLGESLNTHGLGKSFFINVSQFYNNISLINQHLETQSWKELCFLMQADQLKPVYLYIFRRYHLLPTCLDWAVILHTELLYRPQHSPILREEIASILLEIPARNPIILFDSDDGLLALKEFLHRLSSDNRLLFRINETLYTIIHSRVSYGFKCPSVILEFIENEQTGFFQDYIPLITHENLQKLPYTPYKPSFFKQNPPTLNQEISNQVDEVFKKINEQVHLRFPLPRPLCQLPYKPLTHSS